MMSSKNSSMLAWLIVRHRGVVGKLFQLGDPRRYLAAMRGYGTDDCLSYHPALVEDDGDRQRELAARDVGPQHAGDLLAGILIMGTRGHAAAVCCKEASGFGGARGLAQVQEEHPAVVSGLALEGQIPQQRELFPTRRAVIGPQ